MDTHDLEQQCESGLDPANTSGTAAPAPPEVLALGYCWPAVLFAHWFRLAHQIPWTFTLHLPFALGPHGYVWAWQCHRWESLEQYQRAMSRWRWGARAYMLLLATAVISGFVHGLR